MIEDGGKRARGVLTADNRIQADRETAGDFYVPDTAAPKVGTLASPSSLTKTLVVSFVDLMPIDEGQQWNINTDAAGKVFELFPGAANTTLFAVARVILPRGVTVTAFRARLRRDTTSDLAEAIFGKRDRTADNTAALLATLTHATTGWATLSDTSLAELVGDDVYYVYLELKGVSVDADAGFGWAEIDYTMPSYDKGY